MHKNASTKVAVTTTVTPVHGRPEFSKHRNSNHQRNLSLDFRYAFIRPIIWLFICILFKVKFPNLNIFNPNVFISVWILLYMS